MRAWGSGSEEAAMTPNQYPNVSRCPSRCPSKHTREERAKSVFVSGVPVGAARVELGEFGKRTSGSAGRRAINGALPHLLRQVRQASSSRGGSVAAKDAGHLGPRSSS